MTRNSAIKNKTAWGIRLACGLIFISFSVSFLLFQSPLLEMLQKVLSDGQTTYDPEWGTWIITLVLCLLQWGIGHLIHFLPYGYALSYLPSMLLLAFITDIDHTIYEGVTMGSWIWILPLGIAGFAGLVGIGRRIERILGNEHRYKFLNTLVPNLLIMQVICMGGLTLSNTDEVFHYEASVDAALLKQDYQGALSVGADSRRSSRELSVMRAYALSRTDSLADRLFAYPQYDASRGLLFDDRQVRTWLRPESIYEYLGDTPRQGESIVAYLRRLCYSETGNEPVLDYYLCAILLRKELDSFLKELNYFCYVEPALPKAYREALYLYALRHSDWNPPFDMSEMEEAYKAYRFSPCQYRDTYWYYYDHTTIDFKK